MERSCIWDFEMKELERRLPESCYTASRKEARNVKRDKRQL